MTVQATAQIVTAVAANIRSARGTTSRRELATALGLDQLAIYRWETGKVRPSTANLAALAAHFGRDPGWFYTDHEEVAA